MKHIVTIVSSSSVFSGPRVTFCAAAGNAALAKCGGEHGEGSTAWSGGYKRHHLKGGEDGDLKRVINFNLFPERGSVSALSLQPVIQDNGKHFLLQAWKAQL